MADGLELTWTSSGSDIPTWVLDADHDYRVEKWGIGAYAAIERGAVLDEFDSAADAKDIAERSYRARLLGGIGSKVTVRRWERAQAAGPDPQRELVFEVTGVLTGIDGTAVYLDTETVVIDADRGGAHTAHDFSSVSLARIDLPRQGFSTPLALVTEVSPAAEVPAS